MKKIFVSPSVLSADFSELGAECKSLEKCGADWIHCDVMDGVFVPNITFGMPVVRDIRKNVVLPLDVHLMIADPEKYVKSFAESGADIITFHVEATENVNGALNLIRSCGKRAGLSVRPTTPVRTLEKYRGSFDMLLIMSVEPGFGGQEFMPHILDKIREARKLFPEILIEVDGGINEQNVRDVIKAGANVIVAGSAVFSASDRKAAIKHLRGIL